MSDNNDNRVSFLKTYEKRENAFEVFLKISTFKKKNTIVLGENDISHGCSKFRSNTFPSVSLDR